MDLKETDILGDQIGEHWYYQSKARAMRRMIGGVHIGSVLDVGAGSAFFSKYLLQRTAAQEAWCVDISYAQNSDDAVAGKPIHYRQSIDAVDVDLVLLMDVLEHVDDDVGLLRAYFDKVPSGSHFLITVPAFKFLWSEHDVFLDHRRRYTLRQIQQVSQRAGLQIVEGAYFFGSVFPIAAATRLAKQRQVSSGPSRSQLKMHHPLVNSILKTVCRWELPLMRFNRVAGLSAFCLGRKP